MAAIVELMTKPERLRQDQAETLRQALLPFAAQMPDAVRALVGHIDRQTASRNRWPFVMLNPSQNRAVVDFLLDHSKRPRVAGKLWALCFENLQIDTGEIMLSRQQIAEALKAALPTVSTVMSELVAFGAITRTREKVTGVKGMGNVRYFMNPRVGTCLSGRERDDAQDAAPALLAPEPAIKVSKTARRAGLSVIPGGRA